MSEEVDPTKVPFWVVTLWPFSRCRNCNQKILWFNVQLREETRAPYVFMSQNPDEKNKAFCPYCGQRQLWIEDGSCAVKR